MLLKGTMKSIPFNIIIAVVLVFDLFFEKVSLKILFTWFVVLTAISLARWLSCNYLIRSELYIKNSKASIIQFQIFVALNAILWSICYFLFAPLVSPIQEVVIILLMGGLAAGAIANLSIYLPAFYLFSSILFIPLIVYNLLFLNIDRFILSLMFLIYMISITVIANFNAKLMLKAINLSMEKDQLIQDLKRSKKKLEQSIKKIKILSIKDALTDLYNRRCFDKKIESELKRAKRNNNTINLLLIDIDNFKSINDQYGHLEGDKFLVEFACFLQEHFRRANDMIFRYGGDEFAVILVNLSPEEADSMAKHVKEEFKKQNKKYPNLSLSIGMVSILPEADTSSQKALSTADTLLYEAKNKGKDKLITQKMKD